MTREEKKISDYRINSHEYWNNRFDTDWKDFDGNEQTKYFASILTDLLPDWLIKEVNENSDAICDLGCAEGDALPVYRQIFFSSELTGEDISENAIRKACEKYPEFPFHVSNIWEPQKEKVYPVVICSNVVEHFCDTYRLIAKICERASKYVIILLPYREEPGKIDEHERVFHTKHIPMMVDDSHMICAKSIDCDSIYYPYEQLLLIYAKGSKFSRLSDLVEDVCSDREKNHERLLLKEIDENKKLVVESNTQLEDCRNKVIAYQKQLTEQQEQANRQSAEYEKQIEEQAKLTNQKCIEYEKRIKEQTEQADQQRVEYKKQIKEQAEQANLKYERCLKQMHQQKNEYESRMHEQQEAFGIKATEWERLLENQKQVFEKRLFELTSDLEYCKAINRQKDEYILQTQELCNHFATGKLMRLNHFLFRIKGQLIKGTKADRKEFWTWLKGRFRHTNRSLGAGTVFNPLMVLNGKLQEALSCRFISVSQNKGNDNEEISSVNSPEPSKNYDSVSYVQISDRLKNELAQDYTMYDVIILSVIDYNFRHQRPQHFATQYASNGHRVFYINANFIRPDSVIREQTNLFVVDFKNNEYNAIYAMDGHTTLSWMKEKLDALLYGQAVRDAIVIVDYPNWVEGAIYLRETYGFKIITDYMDDYTGFLNTAEDFLKKNCIRLLQCSDMVVASSQFLFEVASNHTNSEKIRIIRNGTEVEHFYQAVHLGNTMKKRKVIGYYGAVAHWFAWEKVCCLAEKFPDCDIVIVGEVTEYESRLRQYANIKLLGEKPYAELPGYLADFDVCLIPFDTSTNLIKATNPVKFYEYLSAGKKIVATEIPELMPYKNEYVYMSNENDTFAEYVKLCLEGQDCLKNPENCIAFARKNDWQKRYEDFESACIRCIPKVSIVVLTYNNLTLNQQCIDSILHKTAYGNYELIIVDNKSEDGTVEYLKALREQCLPNVKILLNDENKGFAGGNNIGIAASSGDYVLLLNNDTVISRGWLTAMVKHLENNPQLGMCNPVTNSIGNESMVKAVYSNLTEFHEYAYIFTAGNMNVEYTDVDRLPLFATLIRKSVIEQAGLLDTAYKVGMFEDDDYTETVKSKGYEIIIVDDAFIHHVNNASFKKLDDVEYQRIFEENKALYEKKWNRKWCMPKYRSGIHPATNANTHI